MLNKLYVGFSKEVELPKGGCLFIHDEVPDIPRARVFDPKKDCFNPLKGIDYKKAREVADVLYTISPQGENTLTVRNGKRALLKALLAAERLDKIRGDEEVRGMIDDILASPVLNRVLCSAGNQFSFKATSVILAKIDRAELGDFDALVLGLFLMAQFKGQIIVPDFGFYGREAHVSLIREGRLIVGCNFLAELPPKIRQAVLLFDEKFASRARLEDAETLAEYRGLIKGTNAFQDFVASAVL